MGAVLKIGYHSTTDAESYTTEEGEDFAPTDGNLLEAFVLAREDTTVIEDPTVSGWGLTWTPRGTPIHLNNTVGADLNMYRYSAVVSGTPAEGGFTVDFSTSGDPINGISIFVYEVDDVDTETDDGEADSDSDTGTSGTSVELNLAGGAGNFVIMVIMLDRNSADFVTFGGDLEEDEEERFGTPPQVAACAHLDAPDTTPSASWSVGVHMAAMAVEIKKAAAPADPPTLTSIDPAEGTEQGGTEFTLTGTDFVDGATVTIGGNPATDVAFVNSTSITGVTPAGTVGTANVVVTNPDAQFDTLTDGFEYTNDPEAPEVTGNIPRIPGIPAIPGIGRI